MCDEFRSQRGFTLAELLKKPNLVLETADDLEEEEEEEDEIFSFSRNRNITSAEMLKYLNINDDDEGNENEDEAEEDDSAKIVPCGTSFEKLKETMTDISNEGKVFKLVKRPGVGEVVPESAMISMHYMGYFEYQDEPFDSSYLRQSNQRIRLNQGSLIAGLEMGIKTMKKHEISCFIIHPDYAYGVMGCPPRIPPNEEVMFTVCLMDYIDNAAADTYENLDKEQKKSLTISFPKAMAFHATANDDFKRNRIQQAVKGYKKVVEILDRIRLENEEEQEKQEKALTKALVNLGVCYNKLKEPKKACIACTRVPKENAKAHFTYAKALVTMGEYKQAMDELHAAKRLEPNNRRIMTEIRELSEKIRKYKIEEKELWSKCVSVKKEGKERSEYAEVARKICEKLLHDPELLRQNLPTGLDDTELDCFKEQAALLGLYFIKRERYGNLEFYISKSKYETQKQAKN